MKNTVNAKGKGVVARSAYFGLFGTLLFLAACNSGLEPQVLDVDLTTQASSCLSGGKLIKLSGSYGKTVVVRNQSSARIDARNGTFRGRPTLISDNNRNSTCLSGGTYDVGLSLSAAWSTYHNTPAFRFYNTPNLTVENVAIVNAGDCLTIKQDNPGWLFRDSYAKHCGDDFFESDRYSSGKVEDVLVDSTFMGMSCRAERKGSPRDYTVTVQNSLIALSSRNSVYLMKVNQGSSSRCKIKLNNNVFLLPKNAGYVDPQDAPRIGYDPLSCSSRNTIVYTGGDKRYLEYLKKADPSCYTVTTDKSVWTNARNKWFSNHSQFSKYR